MLKCTFYLCLISLIHLSLSLSLSLSEMDKQSIDKAYVKKHKINDLLNDLFISLTKDKPESPIEFCIKFFEDKLPPEKRKQKEVLELNRNS